MTAYSLSIRIDDPEVVVALNNADARLFVFIGCATTDTTAAPLVYQTIVPAPIMTINWTDDLFAFYSISSGPVGNPDNEGVAINVSGNIAVRLGQSVTVGSDNVLSTENTDTSDLVTFIGNQRALVCGLGCGDPALLFCAVDLANDLDVQIGTSARTFLMFSSDDYAPMSWVLESQGQGLKVDMSDATTRTVHYDPSQSQPWTEAQNAWAIPVASGSSLADILIG